MGYLYLFAQNHISTTQHYLSKQIAVSSRWIEEDESNVLGLTGRSDGRKRLGGMSGGRQRPERPRRSHLVTARSL